MHACRQADRLTSSSSAGCHCTIIGSAVLLMAGEVSLAHACKGAWAGTQGRCMGLEVWLLKGVACAQLCEPVDPGVPGVGHDEVEE